MWLFQPRFPLSIKTPCDMYSFDYIIKNLPVGVVSLPPIPLWENESPSHRRGLSEETSPAAGWCCWTRTQAALCTGKGADGQPWRCVCVLAVGGNKWFSHTLSSTSGLDLHWGLIPHLKQGRRWENVCKQMSKVVLATWSKDGSGFLFLRWELCSFIMPDYW